VPDGAAPGWRKAAARIPRVDRALRRLRRSDEIAALQQQLARSIEADEGCRPFLTWRPPGHFYSPVPNLNDIRGRADRIFRPADHLDGRDLDGLDLNAQAQLELFKTLAPLANDVAFNVRAEPDQRYYFDNPSYGLGDASIAQAFLRHLNPRRYLEVGSGWTTALALDTNDRWLQGRMHITCVEPYPHDLRRLLRPGDDVEVIEQPVQDVPLHRFTELERDDILFIDCSHVVRTGSDAHHLITRVLPAVPSGVYVHLHDMFWPFEYPQSWVEEGRAWSEAYLLHAFLLFNSAYEIALFNDWVAYEHRDLMVREVPAMSESPGGALWIRRR
jgi:Methyltransferase domain